MNMVHDLRPGHLPFFALRTFEAYARRGDIAAAAAELGITPSAVSHQLKSLEVFLGQALTERRGRRLALTADGRRYFEAVRPAFILLHNATGQLQRNVLQRRVTISVLPLLAAGWFIPRLATFNTQYPDIDIQVQYARYRNYASDEADVSLRFGTGDWPGYVSTKLLPGTVFPVCSAAFLQRHGAMRKPSDFLAVPLVHDGTTEPWAHWLAEAGAPPPALLDGPIFEDGLFTRAAALAGLGVALTRPPLIQDELKEGMLVQLSSKGFDDGQHYFICLRSDKDLPKGARQLHSWLRKQALR
jgi:DNA-binding transcriptional LysR family regulator